MNVSYFLLDEMQSITTIILYLFSFEEAIMRCLSEVINYNIIRCLRCQASIYRRPQNSSEKQSIISFAYKLSGI